MNQIKLIFIPLSHYILIVSPFAQFARAVGRLVGGSSTTYLHITYFHFSAIASAAFFCVYVLLLGWLVLRCTYVIVVMLRFSSFLRSNGIWSHGMPFRLKRCRKQRCWDNNARQRWNWKWKHWKSSRTTNKLKSPKMVPSWPSWHTHKK